MEALTTDTIRALLDTREAPCISIYQSTHRHHPDNQQDPIRFRNLIRAAEESLRQQFSGRDVRSLLAPLQRLANDSAFWNHALDGLAVLVSADTYRVFQLQRSVKELVVVADSFHVKPLLRAIQSADRYQVLSLTRGTAKLFEGNRYALDALEPGVLPATITAALGDRLTSPGRTAHTAGSATIQHGLGSRQDQSDNDTQRYFRAVDEAVATGFSKPSGLPLVVVALPENQAVFRAASRNSALLPQGVDGNPEALSAAQLRSAVWQVIEPRYLARLAGLIEEFSTAASQQNGTADLSDAARAAAAGHIATLLIEADRVIPGRIDAATGALSPTALDAPDGDDVLDDLAELALRNGSEVVIVPKERMPSASGLAAIFRY